MLNIPPILLLHCLKLSLFSPDTDECNPNPCHNNGSCTDQIADFECECRNGWKGKTCTLKDSHCDHSTCKNGGTCQDLGNMFVCRCPPEWEGTSCHIAKQMACRSNPCQNGGTCVNTGDYYKCICREGFEGNHCQEDVNDCIPQPCYNGGKCIDGVNWFLCECAAGFTGPDCRINLNECSSNPCGYGGTCIDHIADFRCICPPGRRGRRCESKYVTRGIAFGTNFHVQSTIYPIFRSLEVVPGKATLWKTTPRGSTSATRACASTASLSVRGSGAVLETVVAPPFQPLFVTSTRYCHHSLAMLHLSITRFAIRFVSHHPRNLA